MIYISTLTWKPSTTGEQMDEALKRRAQYEFPTGLITPPTLWL